MRIEQSQIALTSYNEKEPSKKVITSEDTKPLSKVELIKKSIEDGSYKIDLAKTAEALSKELLGFS